MDTRLKIPKYAKDAAMHGLEVRKNLPKSKKFGITQKEADKLGIDSGVTRAKRIIRNDYMPLWEAEKVARFGDRFKNCNTPKCEGAHLIWGGRKFEKKAKAHVKKIRNWQKRKDGVKQRYWKNRAQSFPPGAIVTIKIPEQEIPYKEEEPEPQESIFSETFSKNYNIPRRSKKK